MLGALLGALFFISPGSIFSLVVMVLIILALRMFSGQNDRIFLTRLFIAGLSFRVILFLIIQFILILRQQWLLDWGDKAPYVFGDDGYTIQQSWWIAQYIRGIQLHQDQLWGMFYPYGKTGYLYLMALFHYLFGYSPISVTLINVIIGALTGIIYYYVAKEVTNIKLAKIVAILVTSYPSLVIWSVTNLKDPLFIFFTGIILWLLLRFLKNESFKYIALSILAAYLQFLIRPWVIYPTLIIILLCCLSVILKKKIRLVIILILIIIFPFILPYLKILLINFKSAVIEYNRGVVFSGGSIYRVYDDVVYADTIQISQIGYPVVLRGLFKGWVYFLLEPFPWRIISGQNLMLIPLTIIWYPILLFSTYGILVQLRYELKKFFLFIFYFFITGSILCLTESNIGTVARMRDLLTPIILMFAAIGITKFLFANKYTQMVEGQ